MLNYSLQAKVADFGLAARLYMRANGNQRRGANQDTFPFHCSAFEILKTGIAIKEKSDVWSFGILMWEIFFLAEALPYANITGLPELVNYLETGQRLEKPPLCPQSLYDLMLRCWEELYQFRPTFSEIKKDLTKFQSNQKKQSKGEAPEKSSQDPKSTNQEHLHLQQALQEEYNLNYTVDEQSNSNKSHSDQAVMQIL